MFVSIVSISGEIYVFRSREECRKNRASYVKVRHQIRNFNLNCGPRRFIATETTRERIKPRCSTGIFSGAVSLRKDRRSHNS